ncbi:DNA mismatch repair endonuclease MutL [uncultured Cetobacterium sp.]|uniref:DNA mismatch repair endonuclease MutL n=1 Tax=uncultured Cetobacterium sp. TaxID=527638 RepID=UPI0026329315|nr:DNA mismatch repair endonuclease MutL [uncultured Cetobacterium sp.]
MLGVIKILDESLSNMIAAGEVVENPASLVKELLENSLDANSKYIKIDIKHGGKHIKFVDDGKGMSREDLLLCIERHATSKISSQEDLFNLVTYGFRGEALSSISAVSKMTISSKQENETCGNSINTIAGKITNLKEIQKSRGTDIEIKDLFFNTPARLKFLRKDSTENSKIKEIVLNEALANSSVSIILSIDGKETIRTSGKGIENTILELFNTNTLKNIIKFDYGYIGNLSLTRSTKDSIFIFVNNRPVKSKIIEEALLDGFYTKLMKGKYPFAIINFNIDPKKIDVNVHPSKKIIKFSDENDIYQKIYHSIKESFDENKNFSTPIFQAKVESRKNQNSPIELSSLNFNIDNTKINDNISDEKFKISSQSRFTPIKVETNTFDLKTPKKESISIAIEEPIQQSIHHPKKENKVLKNNSKIKIIGQFSSSFILVEENNELIIYDQHVVHERILYEKLKKQYSNKKISSQNLLVPIQVSLSLNEIEILNNNLKFFEEFGFEIDPFNDKDFLIRAVPNIDLKNSIENIFFNILRGLNKINSKNEVIENMIISMSCKGAIKANEKLSIYEMEKLITELIDIGEFTCPHGRPITFKVSLNDMEKGFKRK